MQIFEYPYIIITILVITFVCLGAIGIYFALRGIKTANGKDENDFVNISRLQNSFEKSGKSREDRCVFYIGISMDEFRSLYSEAQASSFFDELKVVLLATLCNDENSEVAMYGDGAFLVFLKCDIVNARKIIESCQAELNKALLKRSALNIVSVIIGVCYALGTHVTFDSAINRAKQAFLVAKNEGLAYSEWDVSSGKALEKKIKIENNIEKEIDNNRFFLEYQPILDAKSKKIMGAEVLSRLNSESDGVLSPKNFLSAVDSVGISGKFDYYIFEKNCKWISNNKQLRENYVYTINFSRTTLCESGFAEKIINIIKKYNLNFSCVALEILEDKSIVDEAKMQMISNLRKLKENGISILLDDFGSGYTTFGDLQTLDVSIVKIDRTITQNSVTDTGFIILKNIISTAKDIGFKTLCEGIETHEHEAAAISAGCDLLQGFYYHKPMSVSELEKLFDENVGGI